jgi:hypothetical protein
MRLPGQEPVLADERRDHALVVPQLLLARVRRYVGRIFRVGEGLVIQRLADAAEPPRRADDATYSHRVEGASEVHRAGFAPGGVDRSAVVVPEPRVVEKDWGVVGARNALAVQKASVEEAAIGSA